jgi:hypothetical protein
VLALYLRAKTLLDSHPRPRRNDAGQASAEYALVLLGAAGVAVAVTAWAEKTGLVKRLLDTVFDHLLGRVK